MRFFLKKSNKSYLRFSYEYSEPLIFASLATSQMQFEMSHYRIDK